MICFSWAISWAFLDSHEISISGLYVCLYVCMYFFWIEKCWMPIKTHLDPHSHASHTEQLNHEHNILCTCARACVSVRVAYIWNTYLIEVSMSLSSHLISDLQCRFQYRSTFSSTNSIEFIVVVYLLFDIHFSMYSAINDSRWLRTDISACMCVCGKSNWQS